MIVQQILKPALLVGGVMFVAVGMKHDLSYVRLLGAALLGAYTAM